MKQIRVFNYFCQNKYKCHEQITADEYKWFELSCNSSLQYLSPDAKGKIIDSYGYDQNKYYCRILGSELLIPINKGEEYKLKILDDKLKHGFYKVKITCENEEFRKLFAFNKNHVYLNISIEFARKFQDKYDVNIELIKDGKPNALLYKDRDMRPLNSITKDWFNYLMKLNDNPVLKKNLLLKQICSTAWGALSETNTINKTLEEINSENIDVGDENHMYDIIDEVRGKNKHYYVLLNNWDPYKHNIRLKPWITSYGRNKIASLVLPHIDKVFRIHTDGIVLYEPVKFKLEDKFMWSEEKTTGEIHWVNNNCYIHTSSLKYDEFVNKHVNKHTDTV